MKAHVGDMIEVRRRHIDDCAGAAKCLKSEARTAPRRI